MRLLRTSTLEPQSFVGDDVPPYAILSHTWDEEEVTFQDISTFRGMETRGYFKVRQCCAQATLDGFEYVWIDTCCIDRASSADLSEAINSMLQWYQRAQVCYTYLSDVSASEIQSETEAQFLKCRWFTRAWTLPELLAPPAVEFFNKDWQKIGNKSQLSKLITLATGITHLFNYQEASVAQKFSWAAKREATRVEDQAYCLMGLFDINMAPRYGEGAKAFLRLQLKIIRNSDDESIFAWTKESRSQQINPYPVYGLLAPAPNAFASSGNIRRAVFDSKRGPYTMTNKGLCMEFLLVEGLGKYSLGPLNCTDGTDDSFVAITLMQNPNGSYARPNYISSVKLSQIEQQRSLSEKQTIYIEQLKQTPRSWLDVETSRIETRPHAASVPHHPASPSNMTVSRMSNARPQISQLFRRLSQSTSTDAYPIPQRRPTWPAFSNSLKHKRPRGCIVIATFFAISVGISLFFGIFFTIRKDLGYSLGDAFTLASYIVAVGAFIASGAGAHHYPHCQCWTKAGKSAESSTALQPFRRIQ